jgi:hypothetical protein
MSRSQCPKGSTRKKVDDEERAAERDWISEKKETKNLKQEERRREDRAVQERMNGMRKGTEE